MKKQELQSLVQECIAEVLAEKYSEFQRVDKGEEGVDKKDKGEEETYGAGYAAGERAAKAKYKKLAEAYKKLKEDAQKIEEARFKKGEDIGEPGPGFKKIAKSAAERYGSKEAGQKVAGAILKKVLKKESHDGGPEDLAAMAKSSNALRNKPETKELAKKAAEQAKSKEEAAANAVKLAKAKGIKDSEQITHIADLAASMLDK